MLYDKICREDILRHAFRLARANAGAAGIDGVTFEQIEASGLEAWLAGFRDRVVQTAAKIVLEPIFEADFEDSTYVRASPFGTPLRAARPSFSCSSP